MRQSSDVDLRLYALVVVGALCYTALTFVWFTLPAYLSRIIDDVGLSGTEAGILAGAVPLTYIPLGLASGLVVDRVGPVRSLAAGLLIFGVAQVGRSVAPGFPALLLTTLLIGVGATAITFGLPKLVGVLFPADRIGVPTSIYLVGGASGTALAFGAGRPIVGPILGGWRALFFWSGIAAIVYAAVWYATARVTLQDDETDLVEDEDTDSFDPSSIVRDLKTLLTHRDLLLVVIVATMYLLIVHGIQGWLPTILEARGLSENAAGQTTSLFVLATIAAVIGVPAVADRLDARRGAIVTCGVLAVAGLSVVLGAGTGLPVVAGIVLAGVGAGGLSPLVRAIPPNLEDVGARLTGTAMGLTFAVGEIGGFGGPFAIGALYDLTGSYAAGLGLLVAGAIVVVGAGTAMCDV